MLDSVDAAFCHDVPLYWMADLVLVCSKIRCSISCNHSVKQAIPAVLTLVVLLVVVLVVGDWHETYDPVEL